MLHFVVIWVLAGYSSPKQTKKSESVKNLSFNGVLYLCLRPHVPPCTARPRGPEEHRVTRTTFIFPKKADVFQLQPASKHHVLSSCRDTGIVFSFFFLKKTRLIFSS